MNNKKQAWVVSVNMGYGHQRTAYSLMSLSSNGKIINANEYLGIPEKDKKVWESTKRFYEFISRFKRIPLIGYLAFEIFNKIQEIPSYYPKRDLSKPTLFLKKTFKLIANGWGGDLISKLSKKNLPIINTFFIPAFMAESFDYKNDIFCVICDADISRSWASQNPLKSRIKYFVPNTWTRDRLNLYGVKKKNIFLTGYPLPIENIGSEKYQDILQNDLRHRMLNLDPNKEYLKRYRQLVKKYIGPLPKVSNHALTILFSVGGAGAQKEIVITYLESLTERIKKREINIILSAGIRPEVRDYFWENIERLKLKKYLGKNLDILFEKDINTYFKKFNQKIRTVDILWTKPSELSFYSGLGIPILIAPPLGSQEDFNKKWIMRVGSGIPEENPKYANQWLFDYIKGGRFAEAAIEGFIEVESLGTYNIKNIIEQIE